MLNFLIKICVYISTFNVPKMSFHKLIFFVSCVIKQNSAKRLFTGFFFVFLHKPKEILIFHETWCVHMNVEIYAQKVVHIFMIFQNIYLVDRSICSMCQSEFNVFEA